MWLLDVLDRVSESVSTRSWNKPETLSSPTQITVQCCDTRVQIARCSQGQFYMCTHSDVQATRCRIRETDIIAREEFKTIIKEHQAKWPHASNPRGPYHRLPQIAQTKASLFSLPSCIKLFRRVNWLYIYIMCNILSVGVKTVSSSKSWFPSERPGA